MTFLFGARCKDGVVLIGDTILPATHDCSYGHKIFSIFPGVVIAFAGDAGKFWLFKSNILDLLKSQESASNPVSTEQFLLSISQISRQIGDKHDRYFDILVGIGGSLVRGISSLRLIVPTGESVPFSDYFTSGSDSPHSALFMKKLFHADLNMKQGAELGYFLIKYIARFNLCIGNNLATKPPFDVPTIWYIPDGTPEVMITDRKILNKFESNAIRRVDRLETSIVESYSLS